MSDSFDMLAKHLQAQIDSGMYKSKPAEVVLPPAPAPGVVPPPQNLVDAGAWNDTTNLPPAPPPHVIPSQKDLNRQDDADTQRALINGAMTDMGNQVNPAQIQYFPSQSLGHLPTPEEFAQMQRIQQYREDDKMKAALDSRFKK